MDNLRRRRNEGLTANWRQKCPLNTRLQSKNVFAGISNALFKMAESVQNTCMDESFMFQVISV